MKCQICGVKLKEGNRNNNYATDKGLKHISRHHQFPKRFRKYFTDKEIKNNFQIVNPLVRTILCYECHEEILHNIVMNESMFTGLAVLFKGKTKKSRIKLLHKILQTGINTYLNIK